MKLLLENFRKHIEEATRASKEKVTLPSATEILEGYISDSDVPRYFMQFSDTNKLGINPKSKYNTPLGIYSYPITKEMIEKFKIGKLPFAQKRKNIIIFKARNPNRIIVNRGPGNKGGLEDDKFFTLALKLFSEEGVSATSNITLYREFSKLKNGWILTDVDKTGIISDILNPESDEIISDGWRTNHFVKIVIDNIVEDWSSYPFGETEGYYETILRTIKNLKLHFSDGAVPNKAKELPKYFTKDDYDSLLLYLQSGFTGEALDPNIAKRRVKEKEFEKSYDSTVDWQVMKETPTWKLVEQRTNFEYNLGYLWWLSRYLSNENSKVWRTVLSDVLGIEGVIDLDNAGMIHHAEPTQAVFFSRAFVEMERVIPNTETPEKITGRESAKIKMKLIKYIINKFSSTFEEIPKDFQVKRIFDRILRDVWDRHKYNSEFPSETIDSFGKFADWAIHLVWFDLTDEEEEHENSMMATVNLKIDQIFFDVWDKHQYSRFQTKILKRDGKFAVEVTEKELKELLGDFADVAMKVYDGIWEGSISLEDGYKLTLETEKEISDILFT